MTAHWTALDWTAAALGGWLALATSFTALTLFAVQRLERRIAGHRAPARWPSMWLLRPCQGDEPGLQGNLASSLAPYPGPLRVLLLVPSESDGSYATAAAVAAASAGDVELVLTGVDQQPNRKSAQLTVGMARAAAAAAPPELIAQADSDIRLDADALTCLVEALETEAAAAAFATPVELDVRSFADLCSSGLLTASHQSFFALAALSHLAGGVTSIAGPLAVYRRHDLDAIGGFAALEGLLGEDFEVGRRLHERGRGVAVARGRAASPDCDRSFAVVLARTARWAMVVRRQRPGLIYTYALLLACTPLLAALSVGVAAAGGARWPLAALAALLLGRIGLAMRLRRACHAPVSPWMALRLFLAAEVLMLVASVQALGNTQVVWRGRRMRIGPGGTIRVEADLTPDLVRPKVRAR